MQKKQILIDLAASRISIDDIDIEVVDTFLGGRGLADWILYQEINQDTDALGPDNLLILANGLLAGTAAPGTHELGRAIDISIPNWNNPQGAAYGDEINDFLQANAPELGIVYTIWRDRGVNTGLGGHQPGRRSPSAATKITSTCNSPATPAAATRT